MVGEAGSSPGVLGPKEVRIDGVLYVPVSEAHIDAKRIEDAVVGQWAGEGWREHYPDALTYLRVIVTDDNDGSGQTVTEFIASLLLSSDDPEATS